MNRFPNFPQTIDPVKSETILEQFLELNNNFEIINQGYNQIAPQVETNTTDIEQLKTQVSESGTRVKVNGQPVAEWSPDVLSSDVATNTEDIEQIRLTQSSDSLAIVGLQSDNITNKQNISSLQNDVSDLQGDVSVLNQDLSRSLRTPISAPNTTELVGIDTANSQVMIGIDNALSNTSENPVQNKVVTEAVKKAIIIARLQNDMTIPTSSAKIPLTFYRGANHDGKLSVSNNYVVIGSGVSWVKVSTSYRVYYNSTGGVMVQIQKNDSFETQLLTQNKTQYEWQGYSITDWLIPVIEGDKISFAINATANNTELSASGISTFFKVEVVE